jgi:hypothetical protein
MAGIKASASTDSIRLVGNVELITDDLKSELQKNKAEILMLLSNKGSSFFWHALADTGKTDMDVIDSDQAYFLFALQKIRQASEADRPEVWERFNPYWERRLHPEAYRVLLAWKDNGFPPVDLAGPASTTEEPEADEWVSPYPYSCRDCFHVDHECQRPPRIRFGLQQRHDEPCFLQKGPLQ